MKNLKMNGSQTNTGTRLQERVKDNLRYEEKQNEEIIVDDTMYKIMLMNNDNTSVPAVLDVLVQVFQHEEQLCMKILMDAHQNGNAIVWVDTQQNCLNKLRESQVYCGQLAGETIEGCTLDDGNNRPHFYQDLQFIMEEYEGDENK